LCHGRVELAQGPAAVQAGTILSDIEHRVSGIEHAVQAASTLAVVEAAVCVAAEVLLIFTGSKVARRSRAAAAIQAIPPPIECRLVIFILLGIFEQDFDAKGGAWIVPSAAGAAIPMT
jgi:hypothetical protein